MVIHCTIFLSESRSARSRDSRPLSRPCGTSCGPGLVLIESGLVLMESGGGGGDEEGGQWDRV